MGTTAWARVETVRGEVDGRAVDMHVEVQSALETVTARSNGADHIECPACEGSGAKGFRHGYDGSGVAYGDVDDCPSCNGSGDALCDVCCKEHAVAEERDGSLTLLVCEGCRTKEEAPRPIVKARVPACEVGVETVHGDYLVFCRCGLWHFRIADGAALVPADRRCSKCSTKGAA